MATGNTLVRVSLEELGDRIRRRRRHLDLTQKQLGEMVGVEGPQISRIEKGKRGMRVEVLGRICDALRTTEGALLYDPPKPDERGRQNPSAAVSAPAWAA